MTALVPCLPGLSALADRYDAFVLDLWGVVHDGVTAYPGATDALAALKAAGKRTVLLTNAPRRAWSVRDLMDGMGITPDLYDAVMTSGDAVNRELIDRKDPAFAELSGGCLLLGPDRDRSCLDDTGMSFADTPETAGWVLTTGPKELTETLEDYRPALDACLARGLPMICANPDTSVIREGKPVMCAGAIAQGYEAMGGKVTYRGKPDPAIYSLALELLDLPADARVACVGDGLHTDIPGAMAAGKDPILVTGGLNIIPLGVAHGKPADPVKVTRLLTDHGVRAVAAIPALLW